MQIADNHFAFLLSAFAFHFTQIFSRHVFGYYRDMDYNQMIGLAAGVFTSVSLIPQLIKTIQEKEAKSLSVGMMMVLIIGIGMWIYYGFLKKDIPILVTNIFSEFINVTLLFFCLRYKKKEA